MSIQKRISSCGTAGIFLADMGSVCALVRTWSGWGDTSPNDKMIFRWATVILFIVSVIIVPFVFVYCKKIDEALERSKGPITKARQKRGKT